MKNYSFILFLIILSFSCASKKEVAKIIEVTQETPSTIKNYSLESGTIYWTGSKVVYDHKGTINLSAGQIVADGYEIKSGEFVIDLNSFANVDLENDHQKKAQFEAHLKSADFFDIDRYPTSNFKISSVEEMKTDKANYKITGLLTLKGVTKEVSFPALVVSKSNGTIQAISDKFKINRTDWGIVYASSIVGTVADALIADEVKIQICLIAKEN